MQAWLGEAIEIKPATTATFERYPRSNLLIVVPGQVNLGSAPTVSRMDLSDVDAVSKIVGDRSRVAVTVASGETVAAGNVDMFATINGVIETTHRIARGFYRLRCLPRPVATSFRIKQTNHA